MAKAAAYAGVGPHRHLAASSRPVVEIAAAVVRRCGSDAFPAFTGLWTGTHPVGLKRDGRILFGLADAGRTAHVNAGGGLRSSMAVAATCGGATALGRHVDSRSRFMTSGTGNERAQAYGAR